MKIVHIEISAPFIDNWGYQENLLPKYLKKEGVDNYIIASANVFPAYLKQDAVNSIISKGCCYILDDIEVRRIPIKKITSSFLISKGLWKVLEKVKPDVIFHHNINCTTLPIAAHYAKKFNIPLLCDNHADAINLSKNKLWVWFYYKFLVRLSCYIHKKQIFKAYGVTHSRCDFLHEYYGLSQNIIDFLPIGADVDLAETIQGKDILKQKYGYCLDNYIVVSGGKMGKDKGTDSLIKAVEELRRQFPNIRLVLFGKFEDNDTLILAKNSSVTAIHGWCDRTKTLELLKMANVACWPIHHTTLIEDAVAVCTPLIIRQTRTSEHLIDGNGYGLDIGSKDEIKKAIKKLLERSENTILENACMKMKEMISYRTIAKRVIEDVSGFRK